MCPSKGLLSCFPDINFLRNDPPAARDQWVLKTSWYCASFALVDSVSASVGLLGSTASGKLPNLIKQAISSRRALVAVRLLPALASGSRLASTKPLVFPLETLTTGMPLNVARLSAASTELLM